MVDIRHNTALFLICAAICCAVIGCRSSRTSDIPPASTYRAIPSPTANVGDRFEIVILRPDRDKPEQRLRAIIGRNGNVNIPGLGVFAADDRTLQQLEQVMLEALNRNRTLKGTLRLRPAPIARSGFFLAAPIEQFAAVVGDKAQLGQLDRNEHPIWQWVRIDADLQRRLSGAQQILSIKRDNQRMTLARPAHLELVNERLAHNVANAWSDRAAQPTVTIELRPGAALAMENVTRKNLYRPLLIVIDSHVVLAPMIYTVMRDKLLLTDGIASLKPESRRHLAQLFNTAPKP